MPNIKIGGFNYRLPIKSFASDLMIVKDQKVYKNADFIKTTLEESVEKYSRLLRDEVKEHLCIFQPDGNLLYKIEGGKYSTITPNEVDADLAGNILFHNHPMVQSFSPNDIKTTCFYNAKKSYVVDQKYRYSIERSSGRNLDQGTWDDIEYLYNNAFNKTQEELKNLDELTYRELLHHLTWQKIFSTNHTNIIYTVEKLQPNGEYVKYFQTKK